MKQLYDLFLVTWAPGNRCRKTIVTKHFGGTDHGQSDTSIRMIHFTEHQRTRLNELTTLCIHKLQCFGGGDTHNIREKKKHLEMRISMYKYVKRICIRNHSHNCLTRIIKCVIEVTNVLKCKSALICMRKYTVKCILSCRLFQRWCSESACLYSSSHPCLKWNACKNKMKQLKAYLLHADQTPSGHLSAAPVEC